MAEGVYYRPVLRTFARFGFQGSKMGIYCQKITKNDIFDRYNDHFLRFFQFFYTQNTFFKLLGSYSDDLNIENRKKNGFREKDAPGTPMSANCPKSATVRSKITPVILRQP